MSFNYKSMDALDLICNTKSIHFFSPILFSIVLTLYDLIPIYPVDSPFIPTPSNYQ